MLQIDKDLEQYIIDHTEPESELLKQLNRETHLKILRPRMLSGHVQGKILRMVSHMIKPELILEIGTYTGYSAMCMAEGLTENGIIHTIEINDELQDFIETFINRSPLKDKIKLHIGSALDIVPEIAGEFDLVFIDGDKREYPAYYNLVIDRVRSGGFILADNILWDGKVLEDYNKTDEYTRAIIDFNKIVHEDNRVENVILPLRDGIMMLRKV